jgi:hypothetical protein
MAVMDVPPPRCPGHTCDLGRTQEWIGGEGWIDGRFSDLPPGHFWWSKGAYLAHDETSPAVAAKGA